MSAVPQVTGETFEAEVVQADVPVLVDFWRPGCGPCAALAPTIERLAQQYEGRAKVVQMNVVDGMQVAMNLGIRAVPTIMVFRGGKVRDQVVGMVPAGELARMLDGVLDGGA